MGPDAAQTEHSLRERLSRTMADASRVELFENDFPVRLVREVEGTLEALEEKLQQKQKQAAEMHLGSAPELRHLCLQLKICRNLCVAPRSVELVDVSEHQKKIRTHQERLWAVLLRVLRWLALAEAETRIPKSACASILANAHCTPQSASSEGSGPGVAVAVATARASLLEWNQVVRVDNYFLQIP